MISGAKESVINQFKNFNPTVLIFSNFDEFSMRLVRNSATLALFAIHQSAALKTFLILIFSSFKNHHTNHENHAFCYLAALKTALIHQSPCSATFKSPNGL